MSAKARGSFYEASISSPVSNLSSSSSVAYSKSIHPSGVPLPFAPADTPRNRLSSVAKTIVQRISSTSPTKSFPKRKQSANLNEDDLSDQTDAKGVKRRGTSPLKMAPEVPEKSLLRGENRRVNSGEGRRTKSSSFKHHSTATRTVSTMNEDDLSAVSPQSRSNKAPLPSAIKITLNTSICEQQPSSSPTKACESISHNSFLNSSRVSFGSPGSSASPNRSALMSHRDRKQLFSLEATGEEEAGQDQTKRKEHERAVHSLIEQLYHDLEQERTTVKELLRQERMHQDTVKGLKMEIERQRDSSKALVDRLYQAKLELDQKERALQRALQDAVTWKLKTKEVTEAKRGLEMQVAMENTKSDHQTTASSSASTTTTTSSSRTRKHLMSSIIRRWFKQQPTTTKNRSAAIYRDETTKVWSETKDEICRLREENALLTNTLMGLQLKESELKSTEKLLELHQAMIQHMDPRNHQQHHHHHWNDAAEATEELETSLLNSFERSTLVPS